MSKSSKNTTILKGKEGSSKTPKANQDEENFKTSQDGEDKLLKENDIKIDVDDKVDKLKKETKKKKKEKKLKKLTEAEYPKFKCPKPGHDELPVTHICLLPECPKRLLCKKCLETDHDDIGEQKKDFIPFFEEAQDTELVKDQKIEEFERFLREKDLFFKNLDLSYDNMLKDVNKDIESIREAVTTKLQFIKEKIVEVKKKQHEEIVREVKEYENKFNETFFDFEKKVDQAIIKAKDNYDEFEKITHEMIEAPNFRDRENIINFRNNLDSQVKTFEDKFYQRRLKFVKNKIVDDIYKLLDEVVNASATSSMISGFEWKPSTLELIKFTQGGAPVMTLAEMEPGFLAVGYGFPEYNIEIWDTKSMKIEKSLRGHTKSVSNMIYLPAHKTLVSTSCDQYIKGWAIDKTEPLWTIKSHQNFVFALCKLTDDVFATGSHDKLIKIWKIGKNTPRNILHGHTEAVWSIIPLPEKEVIASCSGDGRIIIWDYESAESLRRIRAHKDQINQIVAYKETKIISASDDCTVKMWDWKTGEMDRQLVNIQNPVWGILVAHDENTLMCYGEQANVVIYNIETGELITVLYGFDHMVKAILETSDKFIITGSYDCKVRYWNSVQISETSIKQ